MQILHIKWDFQNTVRSKPELMLNTPSLDLFNAKVSQLHHHHQSFCHKISPTVPSESQRQYWTEKEQAFITHSLLHQSICTQSIKIFTFLDFHTFVHS
jgi:hypothetical protein